MLSQADLDFAKWKSFHKPQLIHLPEKLHRKLWQKLTFEDYDLGKWVKIIIDEENDQTALMATQPMTSESEIFLLDHAWTFDYGDAVNALKN
jgi:tubulin--tyrosine ligase-like protein 12